MDKENLCRNPGSCTQPKTMDSIGAAILKGSAPTTLARVIWDKKRKCYPLHSYVSNRRLLRRELSYKTLPSGTSGVGAQSAAPGPSRTCRPLAWAEVLYLWRHRAQSTMVWSFVFEDLFAKTFAKFSVNYRLVNLPEHHAAGLTHNCSW